MNSKHNADGKFGKKWSFKRKAVGVLILGLVAGILIYGDEYTTGYVSKEVKAVNPLPAMPIAFADEIKPDTLQEMKDDVLNRLEKCESGGKDVAIVFDTNGKPSVGNFQWQPKSFIHYYQKMTGKTLTEREAIIKALDNSEARKLASYVIFETENGAKKDWVNCDKWHNLSTLVAFIKAHN